MCTRPFAAYVGRYRRILLKKFRNASTRLSMNGKPSSFRLLLRPFLRQAQDGLCGSRRMNGGFQQNQGGEMTARKNVAVVKRLRSVMSGPSKESLAHSRKHLSNWF